jgi:hypothetical protein
VGAGGASSIGAAVGAALTFVAAPRLLDDESLVTRPPHAEQ